MMESKINYYLQIADNALILSHRLSEYCSKGPYLEEDLANTNVALDLIGLAESVYTELGTMVKGKTADDWAYGRKESEFRHCVLVEQENGNFARIMVRQFFMDAFHYYFFIELSRSKDAFLSALALKSLKEVTYHLRRSSEWIIRLGDGTDEANQKTREAVEGLWAYVEELFTISIADNDMRKAGIGVELDKLKPLWMQKVKEIFILARLQVPENKSNVYFGKEGLHSEYLGHILCEIQYLRGKYPDASW